MKRLILFANHLDWLYLLTIGITLVQMAYFVSEFFKPGLLRLPAPAPFLYFVILAVWVTRKEVERWLRTKWIGKRGELYVLVWLIMTWSMIFVSTTTNGKYQIPPKLIETLLYVIMVYIGTCFSKYKRYKQANQISKRKAKANLV